MVKFADFGFYNKNFKNKVIPNYDTFDNFVTKASSKINYYTFNRINTDMLNDDIKYATCEIAELIYSQYILKEKLINDTKEKSSETVGPRSVSYINKTSSIEKQVLSSAELDKECYQICLQYLGDSGLMYGGVY